MPRKPDPELHALWRHRISQQSDSGLTIAQFCAQERLGTKSFYAWKRRLRLIDLAARRPALPAPQVFLPVNVRVVEPTTTELLPIEADLPNGVRLRIPTANARLACRLIRAVVGTSIDAGGSR
jgi:hypothetical protein